MNQQSGVSNNFLQHLAQLDWPPAASAASAPVPGSVPPIQHAVATACGPPPAAYPYAPIPSVSSTYHAIHASAVPIPVPPPAPPMQTMHNQTPAMLQSLSSELASIRQSINELKRTQGDPVVPDQVRQSSTLLSDAMSRLANSRPAQAQFDVSAVRVVPELAPLGSRPTAYPTSTFNLADMHAPAVVPPAPVPKPAAVLAAPAVVAAPAVAPCAKPEKVEAVPDSVEPQDFNPETGALDSQTKRLVRKQRNRQAAQNSRMRKKLRMEDLEERLSSLMEENSKYQVACEELTRRNCQLESRLKEVCSSQCAAALNQVASAHLLNSSQPYLSALPEDHVLTEPQQPQPHLQPLPPLSQQALQTQAAPYNAPLDRSLFEPS
eukprot:TRINITY_DN5744_c0_g1_i2.p1 TRINITY_DN5744_c0_g1~~TRINITY_DN5744_c0_g1_i2.p1  ORF type:complete len:378 (+),score=50.35 TRINITY_DN5744_c0_g1_i2:244-1377(+)